MCLVSGTIRRKIPKYLRYCHEVYEGKNLRVNILTHTLTCTHTHTHTHIDRASNYLNIFHYPIEYFSQILDRNEIHETETLSEPSIQWRNFYC